jgi:hypothetical protein
MLAAAFVCFSLATLLGERCAWSSAELMPSTGSLVSNGPKKVAGSRGAQYELPGGIRVTLAPGSEATLIAQPQMLALNGVKRTPTYSVFLKQGRVDVDIPASATGAVAIAGPADVRAICQRGASSVSAIGHASFVSTDRYPLLVSQKERLSKLQPGAVRRFSAAEPPSDYKTAEAPRWGEGRRVWLAMPDRATVNELSWSPVPGASSYRVELRDAATGTLISDSVQRETTLRDTLPPLGPGNYHLYVRAIDRNNMPGTISAPFVLQIVGVDVPAGAELQPDARIQMSRSQTIQLKNAAGLSLKRATERTPRPASEPVGIVNGKPTPLMIQANDGNDPCLVWLLPKQSPVAAYVGPKWVIWPHESVDLEVRWSDSNGHKLPADVEPTVMVYVGIEPIDVSWSKQGDVWRANVGPQPGHGPWVVRLEIRDQTGALLARDFVEVEKRPVRRYLAASADLNLVPR